MPTGADNNLAVVTAPGGGRGGFAPIRGRWKASARGWIWLLKAAVFAVLAGAALWTGAARGQEPEYKPSDLLKRENGPRPAPLPDGRSNAAVEYFRIWDSLSRADSIELGMAGGMVDHEKEKLTKEQRQACEKYRGYIDALIQQANAPDCNWGVNLEAGWMCEMTQLGYMRGSARAIRMDAYRCIEDRSCVAAAERVAAIIRMSGQMSSDEVIISSLVGAAICGMGLELTDEMIKGEMLNPAAARTILNAMKAIPREDLFGAGAALKRERSLSVEWVRGRYKGPHAGFLLMAEVVGYGMNADVFANCIMGFNESRLGADLDRFGRFFDAAAEAWRAPNNMARLKELSTEVWEGQYGLVAREMGPSVDRLAASMNRTRMQLARVSAALEAIVHPDEVSGAAQSATETSK